MFVYYGKTHEPRYVIHSNELVYMDGFNITSSNPHDLTGTIVAALDMNNDGFADVLTGAPLETLTTTPGRVYVVQGFRMLCCL